MLLNWECGLSFQVNPSINKLVAQPLKTPGENEVLVKVLAAPINPSDLGLLIGAADASTARVAVRNGKPAIIDIDEFIKREQRKFRLVPSIELRDHN